MRTRLAATVAVLAAAIGFAGAVATTVTAAAAGSDTATSVTNSTDVLAGRSRIAP